MNHGWRRPSDDEWNNTRLLTIRQVSFIFSDTTCGVLPKSCGRRGLGSVCARFRSGKLGK